MMNLRNLFKLMFDDARLSDERIAKFTEVCLARLENNNPEGKFTPLIAPTQLALDNFKKAMGDRSVLKAQREGSTLSVDDLLALFKSKALQREGLIRDLFGVDSPEYQEFYPLGTKEYTRVTKTTADLLMGRMATAFANNSDRLPEDRREEFQRIYNDYKAARSIQLDKAASETGKKAEKTAGRAVLERQLQLNLFTLAIEFMGEPDMYGIYFEHSLLSPYRHKSLERDGGSEDEDEESGSYVMTLQPMSTRKAEFSISADDTLNLYNGGDVPLSVYVATTADAPVPAGALYLEPESEETITVADLGPAGSTFLLVNNNTSEEGSIEIAMI